MPEEWVWDGALFQGSAEYYERGRLPYPAALAEVFAANADLSDGARLIDVGCGPGTVARRLAHLFREVVGVDPDPGMLGEAERLALGEGVSNATWICARAEEIRADLGPFRYATFAQSFHWMERVLVATKMFSILEPGGAFVHVDTGGWVAANADRSTHPAPPDQAIRALVEKYLGPERRAGRGMRNTSPSDEEQVLRAAGFLPPEHVTVHDGGLIIERSVDDVVAEVFSMSSSAPHLFSDRLPEFERELREALADGTRTGRYAVATGSLDLVFYRRPAATSG